MEENQKEVSAEETSKLVQWVRQVVAMREALGLSATAPNTHCAANMLLLFNKEIDR